MSEKTELMTLDNICNRVYIIRGKQVMLDYDLPTEQAYHCGACWISDGTKFLVIASKKETRW